MDLEIEPIKIEDESEEKRGAAVARKSKTIIDFSADKILAREFHAPYAGSSYVAEKIENRIQSDEIRKNARKEEISSEALTEALSKLASTDDHEAQRVLSLVTNQLKIKGLWVDDDPRQTIMSEAFPLSQAQVDTRVNGEGLELVSHDTELSDSDFTHDDHSSHQNKRNHASYAMGLKPLQYAKPVMNNLMRSSPRDLYHQTARKMIDGTFFEVHHEYSKLFKCCYFASKGVEDKAHFDVLLAAGLEEKFSHYTYEQFRVERVLLRKIIRELIANYFSENPFILRLLVKRYESGEKGDPRKIWDRFAKVWDGLTAKQQEAFEAVYMDSEPLSVKAAAKRFGITEDSFKSRLLSAKAQFRKEFPEFKTLSPRKFVGDLSSTYTLNGLWHYPSRNKIHELKKIDPITGDILAILPPLKSKERKDNPLTKAQIKAMAIENCPIPYIHGIEYFDGMKPTIMSFGREPGNLVDEESDD